MSGASITPQQKGCVLEQLNPHGSCLPEGRNCSYSASPPTLQQVCRTLTAFSLSLLHWQRDGRQGNLPQQQALPQSPPRLALTPADSPASRAELTQVGRGEDPSDGVLHAPPAAGTPQALGDREQAAQSYCCTASDPRFALAATAQGHLCWDHPADTGCSGVRAVSAQITPGEGSAE